MAHRGALWQQRAALEREWAQWVPTQRPPVATSLRAEVVQSWMRSVDTVDPARDSAPTSDEVRWHESPLREPITALSDELNSIAEDAGYIAAVTDESGTILWTCGGRVMRRKAEQVNFAPGGQWDEPHMGTNALSLALRTGKPHTVFSAEHLVAALHGWVCHCAPIHGPDGKRLGVLDLSTTWDRKHPLAMSTVRTLVSTIEARLPLTVASAGTQLTCLGTAELLRDGAPVRLSPRQLEILTLLALEPEGFTPDRLREAIYGDRPITATTVKAELSHLRRALNGGLANRRYALTVPVLCDAADVLRATESGNTEEAVRKYRGPLLPESDAPAIVEWRRYIDVSVRTAVLASKQPDHVLTYGKHVPYDVEIHEHALRLLPLDDARRAAAAARLQAALH